MENNDSINLVIYEKDEDLNDVLNIEATQEIVFPDNWLKFWKSSIKDKDEIIINEPIKKSVPSKDGDIKWGTRHMDKFFNFFIEQEEKSSKNKNNNNKKGNYIEFPVSNDSSSFNSNWNWNTNRNKNLKEEKKKERKREKEEKKKERKKQKEESKKQKEESKKQKEESKKQKHKEKENSVILKQSKKNKENDENENKKKRVNNEENEGETKQENKYQRKKEKQLKKNEKKEKTKKEQQNGTDVEPEINELVESDSGEEEDDENIPKEKKKNDISIKLNLKTVKTNTPRVPTWSGYLKKYNNRKIEVEEFFEKTSETNDLFAPTTLVFVYETLPEKIYIEFDGFDQVSLDEFDPKEIIRKHNGSIFPLKTNGYGDEETFSFTANNQILKFGQYDIIIRKNKACDFCGRKSSLPCVKIIEDVIFWNKAERDFDFENYLNSYQIVASPQEFKNDNVGNDQLIKFFLRVGEIYKDHFLDGFETIYDFLVHLEYDPETRVFQEEKDVSKIIEVVRNIEPVVNKLENKNNDLIHDAYNNKSKDKTQMAMATMLPSLIGLLEKKSFMGSIIEEKINNECVISDERKVRLIEKLGNLLIEELKDRLPKIKTAPQFVETVIKIFSNKFWEKMVIHEGINFNYSERKSQLCTLYFHRDQHSYSEKQFKERELPVDTTNINRIVYKFDTGKRVELNPSSGINWEFFACKIGKEFYFREDFAKMNNVVTYDLYGDLEGKDDEIKKYIQRIIDNKNFV